MAARTIAQWDALSLHIIGVSSPPEVLPVNTDTVVAAFDASTDEIAYLPFVAPQGITTPLTLVVYGWMSTATSGTVGLGAAVEAVTPGDSLNRNTTDSFDTINYATSSTVPGTAGYEFSVSITLTNNDSIAAADDCTIEFRRDADGTGTTDSAASDFYVRMIELRDNGG